ncbi:MAG: hypothetical protein BWY06_02132 [Candidatus Latescibacteria bacterium ADurb.Bin168]|nr:MAG: hypothetical protein BWY06_02132 [Candidatus Latescibacteria bacterium ADurb.Bin168]
MADQAIEPFRRNLRRRYDEPRHHVFGCRMVPAPDVALTAAFAAKNDFPAGMGRLRFNQRRPACPRETAGDSARSVYLPDRDSASACIDLPAVVPVRREPPVHALELVVDGVQNIGDRLHFLDRSVRSPDVNRFVATYARFGALITTDTRISEITDVREFLLPLETWCGGDHPDPGFPRDRIRYRRRERQRAPEKAFGTKIRGDCLELCLGNCFAVRIGELRVDNTGVFLKPPRHKDVPDRETAHNGDHNPEAPLPQSSVPECTFPPPGARE